MSRRGVVLLALVALLPAALGAGARDYWRPDEPDFAQHAREMLSLGDYSVPYQNGVPFAEKPVLYYWGMVATAPLTGGQLTPFGARVPSLVGALLLLLAAASAAKWMGEAADGPVALVLLAATPLFFWQAQFIQMDALFSGLLAIALLVQLREADCETPSRWRALLGHVALGLAVLTKGPLALVICGLVAVFAAALARSWRPIASAFPVQGALVVGLLAVPWYAMVIGRLGWPYAKELLVRHNLTRFTNAWDHIHPFWYYVTEKIWADFFPWTLPAVVALVLTYRTGTFRENPRRRAALLVVLVSLLFLSISRSKQGKYLLFAYPFAAALLATTLGDLRRAATSNGLAGWLRRTLGFVAGLCMLVGLALFPVALWKFPELARLAPPVALPLVLGGGLALALAVRRSGSVTAAALGLACGLWVAQGAASTTIFPAMDVAKTARPLYERLKPHVSAGEPLAYASNRFRCYAMVVLDRRMEHVRDAAALAEWLARHPDGWVIGGKKELDGWLPRLPVALTVVDSQPEGSDVGLVLRLSARASR